MTLENIPPKIARSLGIKEQVNKARSSSNNLENNALDFTEGERVRIRAAFRKLYKAVPKRTRLFISLNNSRPGTIRVRWEGMPSTALGTSIETIHLERAPN
jgi:hypothetical protein